jgi:hypothetical protein
MVRRCLKHGRREARSKWYFDGNPVAARRLTQPARRAAEANVGDGACPAVGAAGPLPDEPVRRREFSSRRMWRQLKIFRVAFCYYPSYDIWTQGMGNEAEREGAMKQQKMSRKTAWVGLPLLLLLVGCATLRVAPPAIQTVGFVNGTEFIMTKPYRYRIGSTNRAIEVPEGFVTDYATIPAGFRGLFERQGRYSRAAVIHDYLYWSQICTKKQADNIFKIAMIELKVPAWQREPIYQAVSLMGGGAWASNKQERQVGKPRVVPSGYYHLADDHTWTDARKELIRRGVRDPAFPQNSAACALGNVGTVP